MFSAGVANSIKNNVPYTSSNAMNLFLCLSFTPFSNSKRTQVARVGDVVDVRRNESEYVISYIFDASWTSWKARQVVRWAVVRSPMTEECPIGWTLRQEISGVGSSNLEIDWWRYPSSVLKTASKVGSAPPLRQNPAYSGLRVVSSVGLGMCVLSSTFVGHIRLLPVISDRRGANSDGKWTTCIGMNRDGRRVSNVVVMNSGREGWRKIAKI